MIYIVGFAVTFLAVVFFQYKLAPSREPITEKLENGRVFRPKQLLLVFAFLLCFLPLFLISALREGIGTDYFYTYTPRFLEILEGERTYYEIGFYYLNRLIGLFTSNPQWVFVVTSFFFCTFVALSFYRNCEDLSLCVIIFLVTGEYFISLNNLRQALASSLVLFGYKYLSEKRWIVFAIITAIATSLHKSMVVFFAVLAICWLLQYVSLKNMLIFMAAAVAVFYAAIKVFPEVLTAVMPARLAYYIENSIFNAATIGNLRTVVNIVIFAFLLFTRFYSENTELDYFVIVQFIAVALCFFDGAVPAAYSLLRLFTFWQLLSLPKAITLY
ncbi:MAG: EpsG family protein, partial [Clostridiales bacterium]|nr:EpsG family protein [Candidatus Equinaster intestinalis]